jgi:hypothetical protein
MSSVYRVPAQSSVSCQEGGESPNFQFRSDNTSISSSFSSSGVESDFSDFSRIYASEESSEGSSEESSEESSEGSSEMAMQPTYLQGRLKPTDDDEDSCAIDDMSEDEEEETSFLDFPKRHVARFEPKHEVVGGIKKGLLQKSREDLVKLAEAGNGEKKQSQANDAPMVAEFRRVQWGKSEEQSQEIYKPDDVMMSFLMKHAARAAKDPVKATWKRTSISSITNSWDFATDDLVTSSRECGWFLW